MKHFDGQAARFTSSSGFYVSMKRGSYEPRNSAFLGAEEYRKRFLDDEAGRPAARDHDVPSAGHEHSALASMMPTQRPPALKAVESPSQERQMQFSLSMRKELRKELARLAADVDMTMRAFVLNALKD